MRQITKAVIFAATVLLGLLAYAQDAPLGDAARQARQQKQEKDAKSKAAQDAKTAKVITEEQVPEHPELAARTARAGDENRGVAEPSAPNGAKLSAEQWKSQIQAQENSVHTQETELNKLNDSIPFAPGNCVYHCVEWNERQKEKQERAERMRAQLEEEKKRLEDMQESARQQGYGSSVYEP